MSQFGSTAVWPQRPTAGIGTSAEPRLSRLAAGMDHIAPLEGALAPPWMAECLCGAHANHGVGLTAPQSLPRIYLVPI